MKVLTFTILFGIVKARTDCDKCCWTSRKRRSRRIRRADSCLTICYGSSKCKKSSSSAVYVDKALVLVSEVALGFYADELSITEDRTSEINEKSL